MRHLLIVFAFLFFSSFGYSESSVCDADTKKLCPNVKPGASRINSCLETNESSLGPDCLAFRKGLKERLKIVKDVCRDDFVRYCSDKEEGRGEIKKCLKKNRAKLSKVCKKELKNMRKNKAKHKAKNNGKANVDAKAADKGKVKK